MKLLKWWVKLQARYAYIDHTVGKCMIRLLTKSTLKINLCQAIKQRFSIIFILDFG